MTMREIFIGSMKTIDFLTHNCQRKDVSFMWIQSIYSKFELCADCRFKAKISQKRNDKIFYLLENEICQKCKENIYSKPKVRLKNEL